MRSSAVITDFLHWTLRGFLSCIKLFRLQYAQHALEDVSPMKLHCSAPHHSARMHWWSADPLELQTHDDTCLDEPGKAGA